MTKKTPPPKISKSVEKLLSNFSETAFNIKLDTNIEEHPIYSTTLYIGSCSLSMVYGEFRGHIFQDIIHKGYIIALTYGDIFKAKTLYTRIHSSCVTSETLRACDCDCVQQLEGALEKVAKEKAGIVFYLMQEGRGVGYISKARDRMIVQASNDEISTFEAYKLLGLRRDYRQYRNVMPICKMLGIDPEFILLTNNPLKVQAFKDFGLKLKRTETLEYEPSPYNLAYLTSKMEEGHILEKPLESSLQEVRTPEPVIPFKPYAVDRAQRFIHAATYFLPIRPIDDEIVLTEDQFRHYFKNNPIDGLIESKNPLLLEYSLLRKNRYRVKLHRENLLQYRCKDHTDPLCDLLHIPYWLKTHVYFDLVTGEDFVVLTYGDQEKGDIPIVRIQSESLFNRFPMVDTDDKDKYKASVKEILNYGVGVIVLLYHDGRGAGLGAYAQDIILSEHGLSKSTHESYEKLGIEYDRRDYEGAMSLMKNHVKENDIQMIMNSPTSLVSKTGFTDALNKQKIKVDKWIFLESML